MQDASNLPKLFLKATLLFFQDLFFKNLPRAWWNKEVKRYNSKHFFEICMTKILPIYINEFLFKQNIFESLVQDFHELKV